MKKLTIVMYHYVRDLKHSRYPRIKGMDISNFRQQIAFFKENYMAVSMEQVLEAYETGMELPENAVLLTFDDGYIDHYTFVFPILEEAGIKGVFFIPGNIITERRMMDVNKIHYIFASTDMSHLLPDVLERLDYYRGHEFDYPSNEDLFHEYGIANRWDTAETIFIKRVLQNAISEKVRNLIISDLLKSQLEGVTEEQLAHELYLSEDQIRTMRRHGMHIGVHGYGHYWLNKLPEKDLEGDIVKAIEALEPYIDNKKWIMNYPYGGYNQAVLDCVQSKGAVLGVTVQPKTADLCKDKPLELPRFDCNDFPPISSNYRECKKG